MQAAIAPCTSTPASVSTGTRTTPPIPTQPMKKPATPPSASTKTRNVIGDFGARPAGMQEPRALADAGLLLRIPARSVHDHSGEHVGLQHDQHADEAGERDRMQEHEAQDRALVPE